MYKNMNLSFFFLRKKLSRHNKLILRRLIIVKTLLRPNNTIRHILGLR